MIYCTFAGHRHILHAGIEQMVEKFIEEVLGEGSEFCFYTGGAYTALLYAKRKGLKIYHTVRNEASHD